MDKYTIDLDKVLNDFEYSELTEQSSHSSVSANCTSYQTYPKPPAATTKHSINNVFHSLNEYLNSDIKHVEKPILSEINEIETTIPTYIPPVQDLIKNISSTTKPTIVYDPKNTDYTLPLNTKITGTETNPGITNLGLIHPGFTNPGFYPDIVETKLRDISKSSEFKTNNNVLLPEETYSDSDSDVNQIPRKNTPEIRNDLTKNTNPAFYFLQQQKNNNIKSKNDDYVEIIDDLPHPETKTRRSRDGNRRKSFESHKKADTKRENNLLESKFNNSGLKSIEFVPEINTNRHENDSRLKFDVLQTEIDIKNNFQSEKNLLESKTNDSKPKTFEYQTEIDGFEPKLPPEQVESMEIDDSKFEIDEFGSKNIVLSSQIGIKTGTNTETCSDSKSLEYGIETDDLNSRVDEFGSKNIVIDTKNSDTKSKTLSFVSETGDLNPEVNQLENKTDSEMKNDSKTKSFGFENNESKFNDSKPKTVDIETEIVDSSVKPLSFDDFVGKSVNFDDFDISDTEMENELAQLEEEYKEKVEIEAKNLENEADKETTETDVDNNVRNEELEEAQRFTKQDTLDIAEMEKNDVNTSALESEGVVNIVKDDISEIDGVVQDVNMKIDNNEGLDEKLNKRNDNCGANCVEIVKEDVVLGGGSVETKEMGVEKKNFGLLRPNSLDLNQETTPTSSESKPINLIGNPGSTPYNNVYVENSLEDTAPSTDTHDTDPEATTNSLSPTVSEVSTSEASDSPNTSDSCNDTSLDDNLNNKNPKSSDPSPNNNNNSENGENMEIEGNSVASPEEFRSADSARSVPGVWLGKTAPFWTPDSDSLNCQHCSLKFTVIKRRHHCRACGLVLCSKCCGMKYKLEYMDNQEARVCLKCYEILSKEQATTTTTSSGSDGSNESQGASPVGTQSRPLNPGNPMDYCSVVPPLQQVGNLPVTPPTVMVPVGVLKRKGSGKSRSAKSVMFCDGIRPGCDLTELDYDFNYKDSQSSSRKPSHVPPPIKTNRNLPKTDTATNCYIPTEENSLPPTVNVVKSEISYTECANNQSVVEMLKNEQLTFAIQRNLHVHVKIINMDCCINKSAWCFSTEGMIAVGQDEIVILLEFIDNEKTVPKDVFLHLNNIYNEAVKGTSITELGLSIHPTANFLDSKNHAGFLYVKPSFQCVQNVILPKEPYLVGILMHRWETPWAKIFPLRLLLRLGAEYRYYPSPIISTRYRESVYVEIGHTIINLLADFRNFSYTLPNVRGLTIHMKEKNTTVSIPVNRYDQVMKALNNSSDHILAFAANFSPKADSHLVCIQDTHGNNENAYTTHAINIHNKPRKVTGASFIVLNGALKSSSGLTAKSSIVEDGLMIQILPEQMVKLRNSLRNMKDFKINCGCVNAQSDEFVNIVWMENDINFNVGVFSPIDNSTLSGIPSIRVHNGKDYVCNSGNKMIRWTEVFIMQSGDENVKTQDPVDISKLSESISKATCQALVKYLDLLATNSFVKIGIRTTLHVENVSYLAGANGVKLPPIYMKSLDNELIPILHKITQNNLGESAIVIELIFHILNM